MDMKGLYAHSVDSYAYLVRNLAHDIDDMMPNITKPMPFTRVYWTHLKHYELKMHKFSVNLLLNDDMVRVKVE